MTVSVAASSPRMTASGDGRDRPSKSVPPRMRERARASFAQDVARKRKVFSPGIVRMAHATAGVRQTERSLCFDKTARIRAPRFPRLRRLGEQSVVFEKSGVGVCSRGPTRSATLALHEIAQQRNRLRRRRDHLTRPLADAQTKLQHVPRLSRCSTRPTRLATLRHAAALEAGPAPPDENCAA